MQQISRREIMSVEKGVLKVLSKKIVMEKSRFLWYLQLDGYGTAAGAEHSQSVQLRKLRTLQYKKEDLDSQFSYFLTKADDVSRKNDGFRWETLIDLKDVIEYQAPNIAIAGRDNAAYEVMFRCEPSRYMSKARYLIAMRRVFGFNIAGTESKKRTKGKQKSPKYSKKHFISPMLQLRLQNPIYRRHDLPD